MPTENTRAFERRTRAVVQGFLHSVLVVDDQAEIGQRTAAVKSGGKEISEQGGPKARLRSVALNVPSSAIDSTEDARHLLDAKVLTDSFADLGLVCGILKPESGEEIRERTIRAARRSDIVILDWSLEEDDGDLARKLINDILNDSHESDRLRFIAIYTAEIDLRDIALQCRHILENVSDEFSIEQRNEFSFARGPARVAVFGKGSRSIPGDAVLSSRIVSTAELPQRVIDEYALSNVSLVSNAALKAISEIRSNAHRLLARFATTIDSGYLWHRLVLSNPSDAEQHLTSIILAELQSLVDGESVRREVGFDALDEWVDYRAAILTAAGQFAKEAVAIEDVHQLVRDGAKAVKEKFQSFNGKSFHKKSDYANFSVTPQEYLQSQEDFTVLMTMRKPYQKLAPRLESGTIVEDKAGHLYVCVQPMCDTVRLNGKERDFPFLPLELPTVEKPAFDIVVPIAGVDISRYHIAISPHKLRMIGFAASPTDYVISAHLTDAGPYIFTALGETFTWRGQLKSDKAQSIISILASQFSRPGIDDPEWLRRWAERE